MLRHPHSHPSFPATRLLGAAVGEIGAYDSSGASQLGLQNLIPEGRLFTPHVWSSAPELLFSWATPGPVLFLLFPFLNFGLRFLFKKKYVFGCTGSQLWHVGSRSLTGDRT